LKEHNKPWPPTITYVAERKNIPETNKKRRHDEEKEDKESKEDSTKRQTFEIPLNKDEVNGNYFNYKADVFEDGTAEEFYLYRMNVNDILEKLECDGSSKDNSAKQWNVDFSLLEGNAKDDFALIPIIT
jgi:hypothetical protein